MEVTSVVADGSPSAVGLAGTVATLPPDERAPSHITITDARLAIKNLDRFALPSTLPHRRRRRRTAAASEAAEGVAPARKLLRVADVLALTDKNDANASRTAGPFHFSRLSGAGQLHRERARQRRRASAAASKTPSVGGASAQNDFDAAANSAKVSASYRPFSLEQLLQRLATFTIATYSSKPDAVRALSPLGMALKGWSHGQSQRRDEVECSTCGAQWKVNNAAAVNQSKEEQGQGWREAEESVASKHEGWCPWRIRSCSPSLYRVPIASVLELRAEMEEVATEFVKCEGFALVAITSAMSTADQTKLTAAFPTLPTSALVLAMLGWQTMEGSAPVERCIIHCPMCTRRAGLWSYVEGSSSGKTFDAVREHKSYCPMINAHVQSGRWLEDGVTTSTATTTSAKAEEASAWRLKSQVLLGKQGAAAVPSEESSSPQDGELRHMRSRDILTKFKSLLEGYP